MFQDARLKLTLWYITIIMAVSLAFSTVIFVMVNREVVRLGVQRRQSLDKHLNEAKFPVQIEKRIKELSLENDVDLLKETKNRLWIALAEVNVFILVVAGGLAYFLAGKTLQPIKVAVEEQNRFIEDASHELKTPLTALRTTAEVALRDKSLHLKEARQVIIHTVTYATQLQLLTDKLLKSNAPQTSIPLLTKVDLTAVITKAIASVSAMAKVKRITFKKNVMPATICGDADQLRELFVILLDNAVKYSNQKTTVSITMKQQRNTICIVITDEGVGIDTNRTSKIFERFYRVSTARTTSTTSSGYGLGLSIAKQIVNEHHGTISVSSKLGLGTSFTVCLPCKN